MPYDPLLRLPRRGSRTTNGSGGTVTSLTAGVGITLTPNPITTTGTIALSDTAVTPGTYGDGTHVGQFTVNQQGQLTFAANVPITAASSATTGPPGIDGEDGADSFVPGPPGATGATGATGSPGAAGAPGFDGEDGEPGLPGSPGTAGATGATGAAGSAGPPGMDGEDGDEGSTFAFAPFTGVAAGTFGSSTQIPVLTIDGTGRVTGVTNTPISASVTAAFDGSKRLVMESQNTAGLNTVSIGHTLSFATTANGGTALVADGTGVYIQYTTNGTTNDFARASLPNTAAASDTNGWRMLREQDVVVFVMKTGANAGEVSNCRIWAVVSKNTQEMVGADNPATTGLFIGFRFSTGAGDTHWQAVTKDGTTLHTVDTGVTPVADTRYVFKIDMSNPASLNFYINGALVAANVTSNIPALDTDFGYTLSSTDLTATTHAIRFRIFSHSGV